MFHCFTRYDTQLKFCLDKRADILDSNFTLHGVGSGQNLEEVVKCISKTVPSGCVTLVLLRYLPHSLSHSIIWQNTFKTKAKEMKGNEIYWFMFTKGLIHVLLQVISWLNRHYKCKYAPFFSQPGDVYFMCLFYVQPYCICLLYLFICNIIVSTHKSFCGFPSDETKSIFIVATTDLCCFTALWAVAVQTLTLNTDADVSHLHFSCLDFPYNLLAVLKCNTLLQNT